MVQKLTDPKIIEKLAILAASKTGPDDSIGAVTKKVIADYFEAKETIEQYNDALLSKKNALKSLQDKRQEQKSKTKIKTKKQEIDE